MGKTDDKGGQLLRTSKPQQLIDYDIHDWLLRPPLAISNLSVLAERLRKQFTQPIVEKVDFF